MSQPIQGPNIPDGVYRFASPLRTPKVYLKIRDDNGVDAVALDTTCEEQLVSFVALCLSDINAAPSSSPLRTSPTSKLPFRA